MSVAGGGKRTIVVVVLPRLPRDPRAGRAANQSLLGVLVPRQPRRADAHEARRARPGRPRRAAWQRFLPVPSSTALDSEGRDGKNARQGLQGTARDGKGRPRDGKPRPSVKPFTTPGRLS